MQILNFKEKYRSETHLLPLAINTVLKQKYLNVYGTNHNTKDGTTIRDYVHVMDIAEVHLDSLDYLLKGGAGEIINLGLENGFSIYDIIKSIEKLTKDLKF